MYQGKLDRCDGCGNFIEWRYKGGKVRPFNCTCRDGGKRRKSYSLHRSVLEPVLCKKCGEKKVYFYTSPYGGLACFESLAPEWKLHECYHPKHEILNNQESPGLVGRQFWVKALFVPSKSKHSSGFNCLVYGQDSDGHVLLEIKKPDPHRDELKRAYKNLMLITKKQGRVWELEISSDYRKLKFIAEFNETQAVFNFLDDPFPRDKIPQKKVKSSKAIKGNSRQLSLSFKRKN